MNVIPTNQDLETEDCLRARLVELDLLEQQLGRGTCNKKRMTAYKLGRLEDLERRLAEVHFKNAATPAVNPITPKSRELESAGAGDTLAASPQTEAVTVDTSTGDAKPEAPELCDTCGHTQDQHKYWDESGATQACSDCGCNSFTPATTNTAALMQAQDLSMEGTAGYSARRKVAAEMCRTCGYSMSVHGYNIDRSRYCPVNLLSGTGRKPAGGEL